MKIREGLTGIAPALALLEITAVAAFAAASAFAASSAPSTTTAGGGIEAGRVFEFPGFAHSHYGAFDQTVSTIHHHAVHIREAAENL